MWRRGNCQISGLLHCKNAHLRHHASYGVTPLSHKEVYGRFNSYGTSVKDPVSLLEQVETRMANWKLNKWDLRTPVLLSASEKEAAQQQQTILKTLVLDQAALQNDVNRDLSIVSSALGVPESTVREKNRAWLQEQVAKLRWKGEVNKAKTVRDAFLRLEQCGSRDYRILERLCCIYGLAKQGTFEDAFTNYIVEDPVSKKVYVDQQQIFHELVGHIVTTYPSVDILYDFLGFNSLHGYRESIRRYMSTVLAARHGSAGQNTSPTNEPRVAFSATTPEGKRQILFDFANSAGSIGNTDATQGVPDFMFLNGNDIILITISSSNLWHRNRQLPHRKQLEGITRRAAFVFGISFEDLRIRNLLLPPAYMDKMSLARLNEDVLHASADELADIMPWVSLYQKELNSNDVDYTELAKTCNEEEWLTL